MVCSYYLHDSELVLNLECRQCNVYILILQRPAGRGQPRSAFLYAERSPVVYGSTNKEKQVCTKESS